MFLLHIDVPLPLSPFLALSLKIIKIFFKKKRLNKFLQVKCLGQHTWHIRVN